MSDVIFEEDQDGVSRPPPAASVPSSMVKFVYKLGLAKNQKDAEYVLVATIILCIVLAVLLLVFGNSLGALIP